MSTSKSFDTRKLVLLALFTAIVVVLQVFSSYIRFGPFTITLVLLPITIGAAIIGMYAGAWLGLVFMIVVMFTDPSVPLLMAVNPAAIIIGMPLRGILMGLITGAAYKLVAEKSRTAGAILAAIICPIVNTGLLVVLIYLFFLPTFAEWGAAAGFENATTFLFLGVIGINFLVELGVNTVLSPVVVRLVQYGKDRRGV